MRRSCHMAVGLLLLTATFAFGKTNVDLSALNATNVNKVVLTYPTGGTVVTNASAIVELTRAMRSAQIDNTLYDTAMALRVEFFSNDTQLATVSAGGSLFQLGKVQYFDRTGKFQEVIRKLIGRTKTPNQASDAPSETAPGAASSAPQR